VISFVFKRILFNTFVKIQFDSSLKKKNSCLKRNKNCKRKYILKKSLRVVIFHKFCVFLLLFGEKNKKCAIRGKIKRNNKKRKENYL
jgi:hypothetical protein